MEGDQPGNGRRALGAAALFALAATIIFVLVWQWPAFFRMQEETDDAAPITEEQKRQILRELSQSSTDMPNAEKQAALEAVDASGQGAGEVSVEQKMNALRALE